MHDSGQSFLKGLWEQHLNTKKLYKFITEMVINQALESQRDAKLKSVLAWANTEMDQSMQVDRDAFFPKIAIEISI